MDKYISKVKNDYATLQEEYSNLRQYDVGETGYGGRNNSRVPNDVIEDCHNSLMTVAKEFTQTGFYCSIDYDYTVWIKHLTLSLDFYDSGFENYLTKGRNILDQSLEIVFLREKVYPFLLTTTHNLILKGTEDFNEKNTV
jgi:hypothetical protein